MNEQMQIPLVKFLAWAIPIVIVIISGAFILGRYIKQEYIDIFEERIKAKQANIDLLETRIQSKEDLLNEYRERLHLTSKSSTAFSTMSNKELRNKTLEVVSSIRGYLEKIKNEDMRLFFLQSQEMQSTKNKAEQHQLWLKQTKKSSQNSLEQKLYYSRNFQTDTILLRDEILTRLPKGSKDNKLDIHYEHYTNQLSMTFMVNDLERIAKSLP